MQAERARLRAEGKQLVHCHGCFDIVHPGHLRYFEFARAQGDALLVSVSADEVVGKGVDRPYIDERLRAENVAALEVVDYVVVDHHKWAGPILEAIQPDIYVKGKEYENNRDVRFARERQLVEEYGGKVIFSSGDVVFSSTFVIGKFRQQWQLDQERLITYCQRHDVTRARFDSILSAVRGKRVLVVGDAVLDRYVHCEGLGMAAESPMLSATPTQEDWYVGAAGLVAGQLVTLGVGATLLTAHGDSGDSSQFDTRLRDRGVEVVVCDADRRPVYMKTRFLIDGKKVFKLDEGRRAPMSSRAGHEFAALFDKMLADHDAAVVTDFGFGLFSAEVAADITNAAQRRGKPLYVDVSHRREASVTRFRSPRLATPTEQELRFALGDMESGLSVLASRYFELTGATSLIVTLGRKGLVSFEGRPDADGRLPTEYLPSLAGQVIDEVGAGDTLLAGCVAAELGGAPMPVASYVGSALAAIHLSHMGNDPVTLGDLMDWMASRRDLT